MSAFGVGSIGRTGQVGASTYKSSVAPPVTIDFTLSNNTATTQWGTVTIGELLTSNAPEGSYFVLVDEPAGLAVVNG